jgi:MarR family transcriptional regulator, organic hydroperoxide resistance regulator
MAVSTFTLNGQLCFAAHSASRALTAHYRRGLDEIGLTYTQYVVMLVLWERGPVGMGTLCEELHSDSGTLSPLLKRLEKQGLVTRRRGVEDERTLEIACTQAGLDLYEPARKVQAAVEDATGLDGPELAALREDLTLLASRLWASLDAAG